MTPREDVVEHLVEAAFRGMTQAANNTTADEVLSACMTMALRAVQAATNKEAFRPGVERMWSLLPPVKADA